MGQNFKALKLIFITMIIVSCNKKSENLEEDSKSNLNNSKILSFNFPDTIKLNKVIEGRLQYDINNIGFDPSIIDTRFLELILSADINKELANYDEINNKRLLTYVDSLAKGDFKFQAVFEKKGNQTLNIAIRDYMYLKPDEDMPSDKIKLRTSDCIFSKNVYVID